MQNPKNLRVTGQQEPCIILTLIIQTHIEGGFNE